MPTKKNKPIVENSEGKPVETKTTKSGTVVNCQLLNVREAANTNCKVVKCIKAGTKIDILGEEGDFYKTADGFVMKSFIEV